jgi:hypothetical protein
MVLCGSGRSQTDPACSCPSAAGKANSALTDSAAATGTDSPGADPLITMPVRGHTERTGPPGGLQVDEDPQFQKRMWRVERIGWWAITGILIAAGGGLFGHGFASRATVHVNDPTQPASLTLEYERFGRAHRESEFIVVRPGGRPEAGAWSLWISGDYLAGVAVSGITPAPTAQESVSDGVRYKFRIDEGLQRVIFRFKPDRAGTLSGSLRVDDGPPTTFWQWLFP